MAASPFRRFGKYQSKMKNIELNLRSLAPSGPRTRKPSNKLRRNSAARVALVNKLTPQKHSRLSLGQKWLVFVRHVECVYAAMQNNQKSNTPVLEKRCAWCDARDGVKLKENVTHGICLFHLKLERARLGVYLPKPKNEISGATSTTRPD